MADDLTEIRERLQHCRDEVNRFDREVMLFANHGFQSRWAQNGPFIAAFATQVEPIPTALRSTAGMIANEIRACLDALACVLALRNPATQNTKSVYFPISKDEAVFKDDGMKKIKKLLPNDQNEIVALKPYQGGNNLLFYLHEADRIRKHTKLVMAGGAAGGMGFGGIMDTVVSENRAEPTFERLGEEQQVASIFAQGQNLRFSLIFGLRYSEPPLTGIRVSHLLGDSIGEVSRIVSIFE